MTVPSKGFAIVVIRERVETRGVGYGKRYRTVGRYKCYMDGKEVQADAMSGATVEPRGLGNNGNTGASKGLRIEEGTYPLGTHGFPGSKYHTFGYRSDKKPRPGVYVHETDERTAILIHRGVGFKSTVGCINLTGSIVGPSDDIGPNTSFKHMDTLIEYMKTNVSAFPNDPGELIEEAWLIVEGEPV